MAILLAAATRMELEAAMGWAGRPIPAAEGQAMPVDLPGQPDSQDGLLALITGIGPVNAAFCLGLALGRHAVRGVLNLGVAGSFSPERLPLGSPVVAISEAWPEFGLHGEAGLDPRGLGFAQYHAAHGPIFDRLDLDPAGAAATMGLRLPREWPGAHGLTVAGVSGCPALARERSGHVPDGAGMESMEGFALALGCLRIGLPFLEIRTISNAVGLRPPRGWDLPLALRSLEIAARTLLAPFEGQEEMPC